MNLFFNIQLRTRAVGLLACIVSGATLAQMASSSETCPPPPMQLEQQMAYITNAPARNAGFLWRVEKDGRTSWLYGTMHLNHIDYAKPGAQIMLGLRSSDVLALEINPYELQQQSHTKPAIDFKLSDAQLERVSKAYARECLALDVTAVSAVSVTLPLLRTQAQRQGLFWGYSPDARLAQIARRTGKPIVQLETFEQQMAVLAPPKSQAEFDEAFQVTLNAIESGSMQSELSHLNQAWRQSDWQTFVKLEQEMTSIQPEFTQRLLDERNIQMAQKIDVLHREGKKVFVAVGALHMAGKTALPKLMQDMGYVVSVVPLRN